MLAAAEEIEDLVRVRWRAMEVGMPTGTAGAHIARVARPKDADRESAFRLMIRELIREGTYPRHREIVTRMGRTKERAPFGLSVAQGRWRSEEVEAAGYDWSASKKAQRLVRREAPR